MNKIVCVALFATLVSSTAMAHCYKSKSGKPGGMYKLSGECYEHKVECEVAVGGPCELEQDCPGDICGSVGGA